MCNIFQKEINKDMQYAIVSYERKRLRLDGTDKQNIGNWIQTIAAEYLLKDCNIDNYRRMSIEELRSSCLDIPTIILLNGWNTFSEMSYYGSFPLPLNDNFYPIFYSFNLESDYIPEIAKEYMIHYGPIGCRDEGTYNRLKKNNIDAYISGCITALLPKRKKNLAEQTKILFVDVPNESYDYIPQEIRNNAEKLTNNYYITRTEGPDEMTYEESNKSYQYAINQLKYMSEKARLVVTSRLHIAAPCVAMGIPVVLLKNNIDMRFAWLDKYISLYSKEEWKLIDWNPLPVDYENEKEKIKNEFKKLILNPKQRLNEMYVDKYYKNRKRSSYNSIIKQGFEKFEKILANYKRIVVCGCVLDTLWINSYFKDKYRHIDIVGYYDDFYKNSASKFEGIIIRKLDELIYENDIIYLITSRNAMHKLHDEIENNNIKYIITSIETNDWKSNII